MKEQIYTIPVIDAFKEDCECPFCQMFNKLENDAIDFVLGPSYMETDVREQTNKLGFCKDHLAKMYSKKNMLGLALMLYSHLDQVQQDMDKLIPNDTITKKKSLLKKEIPNTKVYTYLQEKNSNCYICNKINSTFERYIDTFFYLWKKDKNFVDLVKGCNGFCLEHFALIYNEARQKLKGASLESFNSIIVPLQTENLNRIKDDLDWFIKKSDYRFANEPWKNSKDALPRSILKINSLNIIEN
ncbi:MAG: DUF6062 family protein [Vallitalea sp.]|jgi:hypothetical protein|nr:DUF6062 family protein [Vallitalea sp.]